MRYEFKLPVYRPPEAAPKLTPREKQVLDLIEQGKGTVKEIAYIFNRSVNTADAHVAAVLRKTGAPSCAALAICHAIRHTPRDPDYKLPATLTNRELEILAILAAGEEISGKELANKLKPKKRDRLNPNKLNLTPNTVSTHRFRLYKKLGAHSCLEAAIMYIKAGGETEDGRRVKMPNADAEPQPHTPAAPVSRVENPAPAL